MLKLEVKADTDTLILIHTLTLTVPAQAARQPSMQDLKSQV